MNKKLLLVLGISLFLITLFGCPEATNSGNAPGGDTVTVYIGGSYINNTPYETIPCYWKGSERVDLPIPESADEGLVWGIVVVDDVVYSVGEYFTGVDPSTPCYWIGTERHDLTVTGGTANGSYGIEIVNGVVYIVGYYHPDAGGIEAQPCYWIDGVFYDLDFPGYGVSIAVENDVVYIAAGENYYWVGNTQVDIPETPPEDNSIDDIDVKDGIVYTAGSYQADVDSNSQACYWTGTTRTDLSTPTDSSSFAYKIDASGDMITTSGYVGEEIPCYWEGTQRTDLVLDTGFRGAAEALMVLNGTVYTAGVSYHPTTYVNVVCSWEGTERTDIALESNHSAQVNDMFVTEE